MGGGGSWLPRFSFLSGSDVSLSKLDEREKHGEAGLEVDGRDGVGKQADKAPTDPPSTQCLEWQQNSYGMAIDKATRSLFMGSQLEMAIASP